MQSAHGSTYLLGSVLRPAAQGSMHPMAPVLGPPTQGSSEPCLSPPLRTRTSTSFYDVSCWPHKKLPDYFITQPSIHSSFSDSHTYCPAALWAIYSTLSLCLLRANRTILPSTNPPAGPLDATSPFFLLINPLNLPACQAFFFGYKLKTSIEQSGPH